MQASLNRRALLAMGGAVFLASCDANAAHGRPGELPPGFNSGYADADGTRLHYVRGGQGSAIVLLHGFPETWAAYRAIMPRLAARYTVVAVDLPGIGNSAPASRGYDGASVAGCIRALVSALGIDQPYLVGHDLGALATYAYIRRFPRTSRGAMIVEAPMPGLAGWEEATRGAWHPGFMQVPGLAEALVPGRQAVFLDWFYDLGRFTPEQREYYVRAYGEEQLRAAFEIYRALPRTGEWNAAQIGVNSVPLAVVLGEDSFFRSLLGTFLQGYRAKGMSDVQSALVPRASHYVFTDNPDAAAELIERWAAQQRGSKGNR